MLVEARFRTNGQIQKMVVRAKDLADAQDTCRSILRKLDPTAQLEDLSCARIIGTVPDTSEHSKLV